MMDKNRTVTTDMVIKNGQVYDSETWTLKKQDIDVSQGKITAISGEMMTDERTKIVDVDGCIVVSGLIDMHCHIYLVFPEPVDGFPTIYAETHMLRSGVTTAVDAGACGCHDSWRFKEGCIGKPRLGIFVPISIVQGSMVSLLSKQRASEFHPRTVAVIAKDADCVVGIKTAHYWVDVSIDPEHPAWASMGDTILTRKLCDKSVMIDFQPNLPERTYEELILKKLRKGDIHTHVYVQQFPVVDERGKVNDITLEARKRDVTLDPGHGAGSFWFRNAVPAYEQGFYPDTVSTDLYMDSIDGPAFSLLHTMSKYLAIGMPVEGVLYRMTKRPAEIVGHSELGSLWVGGVADITVLKIRNGEFDFFDNDNAALSGTSMFECLLIVRNGKIIYNPMAYGVPYWKDTAEPCWHIPRVLSQGILQRNVQETND